MISALSFKNSKRAFRPWAAPSSDAMETFRIFTQLIEKTVAASPGKEAGTATVTVLPLQKKKKQASVSRKRTRIRRTAR